MKVVDKVEIPLDMAMRGPAPGFNAPGRPPAPRPNMMAGRGRGMPSGGFRPPGFNPAQQRPPSIPQQPTDSHLVT